MGKSIDIAIDALKICGYCAIGGGCFYVLSGGKLPSRGTLPFQTKDDTQHEAMSLQQLGRQSNAMTNNDQAKKQSKKDEASHQNGSRDHANWSENTERELRRHLSGKSMCGGVAGLTPECLAKIKEIEKKKESRNEKMDSEF